MRQVLSLTAPTQPKKDTKKMIAPTAIRKEAGEINPEPRSSSNWLYIPLMVDPTAIRSIAVS